MLTPELFAIKVASIANLLNFARREFSDRDREYYLNANLLELSFRRGTYGKDADRIFIGGGYFLPENLFACFPWESEARLTWRECPTRIGWSKSVDTISVDGGKSEAAIASDIERRLLPKVRAAQETAATRREEANATALDTTARLKAVADALGVPFNEFIRDKDLNPTARTSAIGDGRWHNHCRFEAVYNGSFEIKLPRCTHEQTLQLAAFVRSIFTPAQLAGQED